MLKASLIFLVLGIVSMFLGINSIAGISIEIGKTLLFIFFILSIVSFIVGRPRGNILSLVAFVILSVVAETSVMNHYVQADDTLKELGNDSVRASKDAVRVVKDKTCEMVKGKMECALQKTKHSIQKKSDQVKDAID